MNKKRPDRSEVLIDEDEHAPAPGFHRRIRNTFMAAGMGIIFAQVMLFAVRFGSIILWWDNIIFISYLIGCAVLGWVVGEKFI